MIIIEFGENTLQKPEKPANRHLPTEHSSQAEISEPSTHNSGFLALVRRWIAQNIMKPLGF